MSTKDPAKKRKQKLYTLVGVIHDPGDEDYCLTLEEDGYKLNIKITDREYIIPLKIRLGTHDIHTARKRRASIYKGLYGKEFTFDRTLLDEKADA